MARTYGPERRESERKSGNSPSELAERVRLRALTAQQELAQSPYGELGERLATERELREALEEYAHGSSSRAVPKDEAIPTAPASVVQESTTPIEAASHAESKQHLEDVVRRLVRLNRAGGNRNLRDWKDYEEFVKPAHKQQP